MSMIISESSSRQWLRINRRQSVTVISDRQRFAAEANDKSNKYLTITTRVTGKLELLIAA